MKKLGTILVLSFAFACGGGKSKPETTTAPPTDPNTPVSNTDPSAGGTGSGDTGCEKEIAMVCPDGQIDACLKTPQEGTVHKCVVK